MAEAASYFKLRFGVTRFPATGLIHIMLADRGLCRRKVAELLPMQETGLGHRKICNSCVTAFDKLREAAQVGRRDG